MYLDDVPTAFSGVAHYNFVVHMNFLMHLFRSILHNYSIPFSVIIILYSGKFDGRNIGKLCKLMT